MKLCCVIYAHTHLRQDIKKLLVLLVLVVMVVEGLLVVVMVVAIHRPV